MTDIMQADTAVGAQTATAYSEPTELQRLVAVLPACETILILLPEKPTFDQMAAATGLYLSLINQQKIVTLAATATAEKLAEVGGDLVGVAQITDEIANQELWVHFPFREGQVDKVTYDIDQENQRFWLMVKPAAGQRPLDAKEVEFSYGGVRADMIFTIGVAELERLGELYTAYEQVYRDSTLVSIGNFAPSFGQIKLEAQGGQALSEVVVELLQTAAWPPPADAATNLLAGIEQVTDSFGSLTTTAQTLAAASYLMQAGARRIRRRPPQPAPAVSHPTTVHRQAPPRVMAVPQSNRSGETPSAKSSFAQVLSASKSAAGVSPAVASAPATNVTTSSSARSLNQDSSEVVQKQPGKSAAKTSSKSAKKQSDPGNQIRQLSTK